MARTGERALVISKDCLLQMLDCDFASSALLRKREVARKARKTRAGQSGTLQCSARAKEMRLCMREASHRCVHKVLPSLVSVVRLVKLLPYYTAVVSRDVFDSALD